MTKMQDSSPKTDLHDGYPHHPIHSAIKHDRSHRERMCSDIKEEDLSNGRFGVDRVGISFPSLPPTNWGEWGEGRHRSPGSRGWRCGHQATVEVFGAQVNLGVSRQPGSDTYFATVEFNPSRVIDPDGVSICPVPVLAPMTAYVMEAVDHLLTPVVPIGEAALTTLHLTRDIDDVASFPPYAYATFATMAPYARLRELVAGSDTAAFQTAYLGTTTAGRVAMYDKSAQCSSAPRGRVRWELQARKPWLKAAGIRTLTDITMERALGFATERWSWSGGGTPIVSWGALDRRVAALVHDKTGKPWTRDTQERFLGHLLRVALGTAEPVPSALRAQYRKAMATVGVPLPAHMDLEAMWPRSRRSLDFYNGTEVFADAS